MALMSTRFVLSNANLYIHALAFMLMSICRGCHYLYYSCGSLARVCKEAILASNDPDNDENKERNVGLKIAAKLFPSLFPIPSSKR